MAALVVPAVQAVLAARQAELQACGNLPKPDGLPVSRAHGFHISWQEAS